MHGMKNIYSMGLLWMWQWSSTDPQRHVIHSNTARHGLLWDMTFSQGVGEDYALSTGERLRTFRWNVMPSSWTDGPEEEGKLTSRQGETSQMTWTFTNTAVRFSQPLIVPPQKKHTHTHTHRESTSLLHARSPVCPLNGSLGGNQNWQGHFGAKKSLFPCQESNHDDQLSYLCPTQYINYASSALSDTCIHKKAVGCTMQLISLPRD